MKYVVQICMDKATNSATATLVRFAGGDTVPLLVDGDPVEVELNIELVEKCLSLSYLDGLERRIKVIEEDQERLARIEARDVLEYERLRAKFAAREAATRAEPESPAETRCEVCSRAVNIGDDVLYCSEYDTVQHIGCSGLTNARSTPWMG